MSDATFTFRVDEALKSEFASAAKAMDRSGAQLLRDYMREVVQQRQSRSDYQTWERRQVEAGLRSVREGRTLPADEVEAHFTAKRRGLLRTHDRD